MRIGVYSDLGYRHDAGGYSGGRAFLRFVTGLTDHAQLTLFGRVDPEPGRDIYPIPAAARVAPLPYYRTARDVPAVLRALAGSCRSFWKELPNLDVVWIFGPQPMSMPFLALSLLRGRPTVLGVRHDYPQYIRHRIPGEGWRWAVGVARAMDWTFRAAARRVPTVALGEILAARYGGGAPVLATGFSTFDADRLRQADEALSAGERQRHRLITVSRLDSEKNPLLLVEIMRLLVASDPDYTLDVCGDGPLRSEFERAVERAGLEDSVTLHGDVPNGDELWSRYRAAGLFIHVSLTEGLPQVLMEAQANGLPIVATDVGGVASALEGGRTGLLIPPSDAAAAVAAIQRVAGDDRLRSELIKRGLVAAAEQTREAQLSRIVEFMKQAMR